MRFVRLCLLSLAFIVSLTAGSRAQAEPLSCHGTQQIRQVAELLFGRDIGQRRGVSERAWTRFVSRHLTPRFPQGLTVSDAQGQWRDRGNGTLVREPSKRVEIVLPGAADDEARLDAVVAAYKHEFQQQSVTVIVRPACVSF